MKRLIYISYFTSVLFSQTAEPFYGSMYFDNDNDYVFITNTANLNIGSNITIEAWVKGGGDNGDIVFRQNNAVSFDPYYSLSVVDGCYHFLFRTDENNEVDLQQNICSVDATWHHLAGVRDTDSVYFLPL